MLQKLLIHILGASHSFQKLEKQSAGKGQNFQDVYPIKKKDSLNSWVAVTAHSRVIITLGNILSTMRAADIMAA